MVRAFEILQLHQRLQLQFVLSFAANVQVICIHYNTIQHNTLQAPNSAARIRAQPTRNCL